LCVISNPERETWTAGRWSYEGLPIPTLALLRTRNSPVLILLAPLIGCQTSASPPSAEDVARSYPEFYVRDLPFTGLHVDHDADAVIFRYSVAPGERPIWLERISAKARADGWQVVHEGKSGGVGSLHLQRIDDPRRRYREYHSVEIVRITSCGSTLLVAAIQVDEKKQSRLAAITAEGGRWYEKNFWPLVAKYRAEACG
jgi:hypothetical protein